MYANDAQKPICHMCPCVGYMEYPLGHLFVSFFQNQHTSNQYANINNVLAADKIVDVFMAIGKYGNNI